MKRLLFASYLLVVLAVPARAETGKVIKETWDAAYLEGAKLGHFHTVVREMKHDGKKAYRTDMEMHFVIRRYNAIVPLRMRTTNDEFAETGKLFAMSVTQSLDKGEFVQTARVENGQLVATSGSEQPIKRPWDDKAVGPYYADLLFKKKDVKPGSNFIYTSYELSILQPVTMRVAVKAPEEVDLLLPAKGGDKVRRVRRSLLRVEIVPDKVNVAGNDVPLPRMVSWLNSEHEVVRSETEMPGLGRILLYRTTKALAQEAGAAPELLPDLGLTTLIPLNRTVKNPHDARTITFRIRVDGDDKPETTFEKDARQSVLKSDGDSFDLYVKAVRTPAATESSKKADPEYLKSSYFLNARDPRVRELAREAVGDATDPLEKAKLIEKWVHEHMKSSSAVGFATAGQVARELRGDCRQHAMLTAAMCRAAGVPARTALGLVYYDDPGRGPALAFHMWTEVWVKGQWLGLDATLGRGSIGPAHLKISSPSWNDTQTLAPLLPVTRVMGKIKAEIIRVTIPKRRS